MDIRILQYFLTVAREKNITKAAEALHMTQPPLSRQLKELEEELGTQLLIRGSKKITLTEDGILLKKRAEEMLSLLEKTKAELTTAKETLAGDIYIGSGETDGLSILADTARKLQEKYPLIHYHIYSGDAGPIIEKLDKGLIDFALLVEPVDVMKYNFLRLPVKDIWGVIMRKDSPLAEKEQISPEDLWDKPLLISSQQVSTSSELCFWMGKDMAQLNIMAHYDLAYNASRFVKMGCGYAIVLNRLVGTGEESPLCFRPLTPTLEVGMCLAWKKHQIFSRAAEKFLQCLQAELAAGNYA